ncbi:Translation initiation factor 2 [[Actinomadura] parvosata subsp. kistnae]|uniref:Uncharacterized protein n=1 Tax=[Actinomadura] parvosata subsp. kistnae TaxID=1909395 RepID=A0A1V0AG17_9ACTN|nr:hypothetical protein [Nonomuraea sp. ATCC 55076]AQZ69158.1 hypothetical protein BKM31_53725 [Nonomuraea sp. ATCC 55076]SPL92249.1 Translation initiation factor 2 [Actinomadura parvosata subsp. kistnae]
MGRHGTGGSDDGDERGNSAFWGPDEQAEPPGWPSLPDRPEVTGQWAPMPRRTDAPPPRGPQPEPFETTGAFALPSDLAGGLPPANDPAGAFPPPRGPKEDEAGPFETTGAFARPPEWDQQGGRGDFSGPSTGDFPANGPDGTAVFGAPGAPGPGAPGSNPFDRPGPLDAAAERTSFFDVPAERTAFFDGPPDRMGAPAPGQPDPGRPGDGRPPFGRPGEGTGPFGAADPEGTARFDAPSGPTGVYSGPPEPGDIKVAGEPTAALTPAWASAETGFLDSGWSNDPGPQDDEPRGRRGRRKQGRGAGGGGGGDDVLAAPSGPGKGRVALLSVAAVAVVLGGTVAGVKFMSSSGEPGKCEGATCAAVQVTSSAPGPAVSEPAEEDSEAPTDEEPAEEAAEDSEPAETPTPTASSNVRTPQRVTTTPTPSPSKSKTKKPAEPKDEETEDPPVEESVSETPSDEVSTLDDTHTDTGAGTPGGSTPAPTFTGSVGSTGGNAGSVNVKQTIKQRLATYSADLTLSNTSPQTLENPTVSVPVDGRVTDVDGAEWTQDGDLLILDLTVPLAAGESVEVTFTATGRGSEAQNCGLVAGECVVA